MKTSSCTIVVVLALAASPARAEPATGFMVQGLIASNLVIGGLSYYGPAYNVMPSLRIGGQLPRLAIAAELNYGTVAVLDGSDTGTHLIAVGPSLQPVVWRSADRNARLAIACGFNIGAAISTRSSSGPYGSSSSDSAVTGGFNGALHGSYFLHPSFGLGLEGGVRTQIVNMEGDHIVVAAVYVALSLTFVAGK